jgi:hypothetical protein
MKLPGILLMLQYIHTGSSIWETIIMFFILTAIPLSWVIPIIVKRSRKRPPTLYNKQPYHDDKIDKLERLSRLKEQGTISEEEFIAEKNRILNQNP